MNISELYTTEWCAACKLSKDRLLEAGIIDFEVISVDEEDKLYKAFRVWEERLGHNPNSIPQFWYRGQYVGGSAQIEKFIKEYHVN